MHASRRLPSFLVGCLIVLSLVPLVPFAVHAQDATPVDDLPDGVSIVASGLTNPRGFTWDADGSLHLALAGVGGETEGQIGGQPSGLFGGPTASVVTVDGGCTTPIAEGLPSGYWKDAGWIWGVMDIGFLGDALYALVGGGGTDFGNPDTPSGVYRITADGEAELVADLSQWFRDNPPVFSPPDYNEDGSLFDMEAGDDKLWISEAVGGRLLTVTPDGAIALVADLSEGHLVPTGVALAPDGGAYVGFETVIPYPAGSSKVVHVHEDGTVEDVWTGLTAVTDVVLGPDGALYAAEMATDNLDEPPYLNPNSGRIVRQTGPDSLEPVVTDADYPVTLGFDDAGDLYLAYPAFGTATAEGEGALLQLDLDAAPISLADLGEIGPSCQGGPGTSAGPTAASPAASPVAATMTVDITDFAFSPASLEIPTGTTVTWTNADGAPHTVTAADGAFDSGRLDEGATFSVTFDAPGTYAYGCSFHPAMQAEVVVV